MADRPFLFEDSWFILSCWPFS